MGNIEIIRAQFPIAPRMVRRLGLPQADEIASLLERVREAKTARR
jgi:hypothetical protein